MQITIGNLGAVIGTQLYRENDGPRYFRGHGTALGYLVGNILVVSVLWAVLKKEAAAAVDREYEGEWKGDEDVRWKFQT
jgi:hypothetical protein